MKPEFPYFAPQREAQSIPIIASKAPRTTPPITTSFFPTPAVDPPVPPDPLAVGVGPVFPGVVVVTDVAVLMLGKMTLQVTLAGHGVGPSLDVQRVVWPVHFTLVGQTVALCVPPGRTHVHVGWAEHGNGPSVPVKVTVWPVQVVFPGQVVIVVMLVVVTVPFP